MSAVSPLCRWESSLAQLRFTALRQPISVFQDTARWMESVWKSTAAQSLLVKMATIAKIFPLLELAGSALILMAVKAMLVDVGRTAIC